ncbi:MAG TPA: plastocyanin/azurin family copper-binding protein [Afifellaceae bacterium]|nr:plastocyanin/azurin family copper-binding protein [Afifellaceae bacterium]
MMTIERAAALGAATLALVICSLAATASAQEKDITARCAEAAERYQEMTGKAPGDEDVPVVLAYRYVFCPQKLEVPAGTTVRWVNVEKRTSHSVWFKEAGRDESDRIFPEEKVELTLDLPAGEHPYLCGPHWESHDMVGMVTITE